MDGDAVLPLAAASAALCRLADDALYALAVALQIYACTCWVLLVAMLAVWAVDDVEQYEPALRARVHHCFLHLTLTVVGLAACQEWVVRGLRAWMVPRSLATRRISPALPQWLLWPVALGSCLLRGGGERAHAARCALVHVGVMGLLLSAPLLVSLVLWRTGALHALGLVLVATGALRCVALGVDRFMEAAARRLARHERLWNAEVQSALCGARDARRVATKLSDLLSAPAEALAHACTRPLGHGLGRLPSRSTREPWTWDYDPPLVALLASAAGVVDVPAVTNSLAADATRTAMARIEDAQRCLAAARDGRTKAKRRADEAVAAAADAARALEREEAALAAELSCPVCLDTLVQAAALPGCAHVFCGQCLSNALAAGGPRCPLCREPAAGPPLPLPEVDDLVRARRAER